MEEHKDVIRQFIANVTKEKIKELLVNVHYCFVVLYCHQQGALTVYKDVNGEESKKINLKNDIIGLDYFLFPDTALNLL